LSPSQLQAVEYSQQRILTSLQLAAASGTTPARIANNFNANKDWYIAGKDYCLEGEDLKAFLTNSRINKLYP
jgi:hypothetical protein